MAGPGRTRATFLILLALALPLAGGAAEVCDYRQSMLAYDSLLDDLEAQLAIAMEARGAPSKRMPTQMLAEEEIPGFLDKNRPVQMGIPEQAGIPKLRQVPDRVGPPDVDGRYLLPKPDKIADRAVPLQDAYQDLGIPRAPEDKHLMLPLDSRGTPYPRGHEHDPYYSGWDSGRETLPVPAEYDNLPRPLLSANMSILDETRKVPERVKFADLEMDKGHMLTEKGHKQAIAHIKEKKGIKGFLLTEPITLLGEGASGAVYKVCRKEQGCRAIKVLKPRPMAVELLAQDLYLEDLAENGFSQLSFTTPALKKADRSPVPIKVAGKALDVPGNDGKLVRGLKQFDPDGLADGLQEMELVDWAPDADYERFTTALKSDVPLSKYGGKTYVQELRAMAVNEMMRKMIKNDAIMEEFFLQKLKANGMDPKNSVKWPTFKNSNGYQKFVQEFQAANLERLGEDAQDFLAHMRDHANTGPELSKVFDTLKKCEKVAHSSVLTSICTTYRQSYNIPDDMVKRILSIEQGYRDTVNPAIRDRRANFPSPDMIRGNVVGIKEIKDTEGNVVGHAPVGREIGLDYNHGDNVLWLRSEARSGRGDR